MKPVSLLSLALSGFAVCAASSLAWAQSSAASAPAPGGGLSMWSIIVQGLEWPAYFIIAGSIAMVALVVEHFITIRVLTIAPPDQVKRARDQIERRAFRECLDSTKKSSTYFARLMTAALHHARHGFDAMHEAALEKSGELGGQLFRKVEYMNILGNLGPLMGLLGTVYGMIVAFGQLGEGGGEATADKLARGISLALVNTMLGLALAIVGLLFFGICRNRIESLTVQATVSALDLLEYFRPVAQPATTGEARRTTRLEEAASPPV